ncbi:MAG: sodium:solute symporter [Candidatus Krumholzibacteria bacterium]|nr:sodium:solute symporter [Candidatus Krumholzibacteria bacterium]MDP6669701.1 sodium:solute symporter [Candidatus Krumholzibacteria bacterium]MDP7021316.1 sodium:solute symporter [Candidatus Krumholzibacteria bacterium]
MNFTLLDWGIVAVVLALMVSGILLSRNYMRGVADFLAAGRNAGRYVLSLSQGIAGLGAITIVGLFEMNFIAGFSMSWWGLTMGVVILLMTVSGWVVYRFRQTRALTLAEFFEKRYSRNFRIFAGLIAWLSGIINFGIFPAVGARFFIHFCGFPEYWILGGISLPVFPLLMLFLLSLALYFVFSGGQVAVIITDFIQGVFVNLVFLVILFYLMSVVEWGQIMEALASAPDNASLINPYKTSHVEDFNLVFFLIGIFGVFYGAMSWQGTQGYNASAKTAHEAKMGSVLTNWRGFPQGIFLLMVPIMIYTVMRHPDWSALSSVVQGQLQQVDSETLRNQLRAPLVLVQLLPPGLLGAFGAVMLAAFISTHDTYLHSWGSIFVQDVILPFRKKELTPKQHLLALRLSIFGVALFIFFFSLLFQQSEYIFLFFAITGAIFAGGSGAVIIGGLYWKRGTAAGAWTALSSGAMIAVGGILIHRLDAGLFELSRGHLPALARHFWSVLHWLYEINGQQYWALAMFASTLLYVAVSLLGRREVDLDRLLHRNEHAIAGEMEVVEKTPTRGWKVLGMGREFTRGDKVIYIASYAWTAIWTLIFLVGSAINLKNPADDSSWGSFWKTYVMIQIVVAVFVMVWFTIGGVRDLREMFSRLGKPERDESDDGRVDASSS